MDGNVLPVEMLKAFIGMSERPTSCIKAHLQTSCLSSHPSPSSTFPVALPFVQMQGEKLHLCVHVCGLSSESFE